MQDKKKIIQDPQHCVKLKQNTKSGVSAEKKTDK
jgi:hypothetical protein